ncbi:MAG: hypothetical protein BRC30_03160 [Nanohaloarchaea archaeon SW_7_46_7]|nr:MAG: hypothetical protein BRC30_03160 [Nanohaloarchaea archaeon SW_7_46_7]
MKALFFEPHDDDLIIGAGGTVIQMLEQGWEVRTVQMTDCRHGSTEIDPEKLVKIRKEEKEEETEFLGIECSFLDFEDGSLQELAEENPEKALEEIKNHLHDFRPDVVFMPGLDEGHPDHRGTHLLVSQAVDETGLEVLKISYLVWQLPFLEGENRIEKVLEVEVGEEVYEEKLHGIQLHESQEVEGRYSEMAEHFNSYLGLLYSSRGEKGLKRSEVLGVQNPEKMEILEGLDFNDVSELSHGRESEDISVN